MHLNTYSNSACITIIVAWILVLSGVTLPSMQAALPTKMEKRLETETFSAANQNVTIDPDATFTVLPKEVNVNINDTFVIRVHVANITDMYAWQVHICFDSAILTCLGVYVPLDYVFSYARNNTVGRALVEYNSTEFTNPLHRISEGWVLAGDCLIAHPPTFNGSATICHIKFRAISIGSSTLTLSSDYNNFGTYFLNSNLDLIVASTYDGTVNVRPP